MTESKKNILYILGAGASVGALSVVSEMKERMFLFLLFLYAFKDKKHNTYLVEESYRLVFNEKENILRLCIEWNILQKTTFDEFCNLKRIENKNSKNPSKDSDYDILKLFLVYYLKFEEEYGDENIRWIFFEFAKISIKDVNSFFKNAYFVKNSGENIPRSKKQVIDIFLNRMKSNGENDEHVQDVCRWIEKAKIFTLALEYLFDFRDTGYNDIEFVNNKTTNDERYNNWLASLDVFENAKSRIKIYSWNYDNQLISNNFEPIKLNGCYKECLKEIESNNVFKIKDVNTKMRFAYDTLRYMAPTRKDEFKKHAKLSEKKDVDFLINVSRVVIIGYSFPSINSYFDNQIFKNLDFDNNKNIVIDVQTNTIDDFKNIEKRIRDIVGDFKNLIINYENKIDSFFIPPDF